MHEADGLGVREIETIRDGFWSTTTSTGKMTLSQG
jgi:hypothetical protein